MKESFFLDFNVDNIFKNLIQTEDHLRRLHGKTTDEGHASCVTKHLLFVEGEAEEAISHSSIVSPEKIDLFSSVARGASGVRASLNGDGVDESIKKVRDLRKQMEVAYPEYNTSFCKACTIGNSNGNVYIPGNLNNTKQDYSIKYRGEKKVLSNRDVGVIAAGSFGGKALQEIAAYSDTMVAPIGGIQVSKLVNILGGAALAIGGLKFIKNDDVQLAAVVAGVNTIVSKGIDYVKEAAGMGAGLSLSLASPIAIPTVGYTSPLTAVIGGERAFLL